MIKKFIFYSLLIIFAGAMFYAIAPKWHFSHGGVFRANEITGKSYRLSEGRWKLWPCRK